LKLFLIFQLNRNKFESPFVEVRPKLYELNDMFRNRAPELSIRLLMRGIRQLQAGVPEVRLNLDTAHNLFALQQYQARTIEPQSLRNVALVFPELKEVCEHHDV